MSTQIFPMPPLAAGLGLSAGSGCASASAGDKEGSSSGDLTDSPGERKWCDTPPSKPPQALTQQQAPAPQAFGQHAHHPLQPHHHHNHLRTGLPLGDGVPSQSSIQFQISQLSLADENNDGDAENCDEDAGVHVNANCNSNDGSNSDSDSDSDDDGLATEESGWGHTHGRRRSPQTRGASQPQPQPQQVQPQNDGPKPLCAAGGSSSAASFGRHFCPDGEIRNDVVGERGYSHEDVEHCPAEQSDGVEPNAWSLPSAEGKKKEEEAQQQKPQPQAHAAAPQDSRAEALAGTKRPTPQPRPLQPAPRMLQVQHQLQMQQDQWQKWGHGAQQRGQLQPPPLTAAAGVTAATAMGRGSAGSTVVGGARPLQSSLLRQKLQGDSGPAAAFASGNQQRREDGAPAEAGNRGGPPVAARQSGEPRGRSLLDTPTETLVERKRPVLPTQQLQLQLQQQSTVALAEGVGMARQRGEQIGPPAPQTDAPPPTEEGGPPHVPPSSSIQSSSRSGTGGGGGGAGSGVFPASLSSSVQSSSLQSASVLSRGAPTPLSVATCATGNTPPPTFLLPPASGGGGGPGGPTAYPAGALPIQYYAQQATATSNRPLLYSAIGSLEQGSMHSMGSFGRRLMGTAAAAAAAASATPPKSALGGCLCPPPDSKHSQQLAAARGGSGTLAGPMLQPPGARHPQRVDASGAGVNKAPQGRGSFERRPPSLWAEKKAAPQRKELEAERAGAPQGAEPAVAKAQAQRGAPTLKKGRKKGAGEGKKKKKRVTIDTSKTSTAIISPPRHRQAQERAKEPLARAEVKAKAKKAVPPPAAPVEMFRPSCDAYTPRLGQRRMKDIQYKPAEKRTPQVQRMSTTMGTIQRPNFRDALRRVAMILHEHVTKIERRFEGGVRGVDDTGLFLPDMRDLFAESNFVTPRYKCSLVRLPMARPGAVYGLRRIKDDCSAPTTNEIYEFGHRLFKSVQLSSECSIVCLIYIERLMEVARVPLVSSTWRPVFMCGLLLASKVWQDLSSWNIEFASVYPQFSLEAINRLEATFLRTVKWDLYISSSLYAKYYFALRSLLEKQDFRRRYNRMVGAAGSAAASDAMKVQRRSERAKEEALLQLSRSM